MNNYFHFLTENWRKVELFPSKIAIEFISNSIWPDAPEKQNIILCVSYFQTHDDFKVDIMDMRDMSDIGSLFGTGKDEQRTSPEEPG